MMGEAWVFSGWCRVRAQGGLMPVSRVRGGRRRRKRVERAGQELLLLMVLILVCSAGALAQSGEGKPSAIAPISATVTVEAPSRELPAEVSKKEIAVNELAPMDLRELVGRIADLAGVDALLEDRPGRVADGDVEMRPAVPFGLSMTGTVPAVLDEVARLSGYDWGWAEGRLVFYRYADIGQRPPERVPGGVHVDVLAAVAGEETPEPAPEVDSAVPEGVGGTKDAEGAPEAGRVAASVPGELEPGGRPVVPDARASVEGQGEAAPAEQVPPAPAGWEVSPDVHGTVEGVLRAWAERAGWQVAWESKHRFEVGAAAEFEPGETEEAGFLAAADALLAIGPMRRSLSATAYPNKWLVVQDVGSTGQ